MSLNLILIDFLSKLLTKAIPSEMSYRNGVPLKFSYGNAVLTRFLAIHPSRDARDPVRALFGVQALDIMGSWTP